jgi:hypothetical protein
MNSTPDTPEEDFPDSPPPASVTPKVVTMEEQRRMLQAWETQAGQRKWGTAHLILGRLKIPMTQENFLRHEGLGGRDLDEVLEDLEGNVADEIVPPWFGQLPRGD